MLNILHQFADCDHIDFPIHKYQKQEDGKACGAGSGRQRRPGDAGGGRRSAQRAVVGGAAPRGACLRHGLAGLAARPEIGGALGAPAQGAGRLARHCRQREVERRDPGRPAGPSEGRLAAAAGSDAAVAVRPAGWRVFRAGGVPRGSRSGRQHARRRSRSGTRGDGGPGSGHVGAAGLQRGARGRGWRPPSGGAVARGAGRCGRRGRCGRCGRGERPGGPGSGSFPLRAVRGPAAEARSAARVVGGSPRVQRGRAPAGCDARRSLPPGGGWGARRRGRAGRPLGLGGAAGCGRARRAARGAPRARGRGRASGHAVVRAVGRRGLPCARRRGLGGGRRGVGAAGCAGHEWPGRRRGAHRGRAGRRDPGGAGRGEAARHFRVQGGGLVPARGRGLPAGPGSARCGAVLLRSCSCGLPEARRLLGRQRGSGPAGAGVAGGGRAVHERAVGRVGRRRNGQPRGCRSTHGATGD